jgi:hypothetical protein
MARKLDGADETATATRLDEGTLAKMLDLVAIGLQVVDRSATASALDELLFRPDELVSAMTQILRACGSPPIGEAGPPRNPRFGGGRADCGNCGLRNCPSPDPSNRAAGARIAEAKLHVDAAASPNAQPRNALASERATFDNKGLSKVDPIECAAWPPITPRPEVPGIRNVKLSEARHQPNSRLVASDNYPCR